MAATRPQVAHGRIKVTKKRPKQPICAGKLSGIRFNRRSHVRRDG